MGGHRPRCRLSLARTCIRSTPLLIESRMRKVSDYERWLFVRMLSKVGDVGECREQIDIRFKPYCKSEPRWHDYRLNEFEMKVWNPHQMLSLSMRLLLLIAIFFHFISTHKWFHYDWPTWRRMFWRATLGANLLLAIDSSHAQTFISTKVHFKRPAWQAFKRHSVASPRSRRKC